ncbi:kinesin-like protein KIN-7F [Hibiscus syriacus]|uniref:kinesin-like protein KIN-7F n=1 Tax=Hibiscus syriacus TaxID=106335 RepID=UPI001923980D|nr:kinesin-like protein KIN-7F [Hibiscus syriacus]
MNEEAEIQEQGEKFFVSVRLRPLNDKERARNSISDWECINNDTIVFKNSLPERSMFPVAYSFDRVFDCDSPTSQVYEEAAKDIAVSVLNGINSSIFAYGQTSSGKTYTMRGVTDYAVADIYDYIERHQEREFFVKFSAMEIYNEAVRDLLSSDSTPLRLLDDPERGTVVERLTEETLRDKEHLQELLSICEAQRQIGETALNETSSRSHQILRLTIESFARDYAEAGNSSVLAASVNFIDLAGSERASQTLSAGARLKEGCHINRSLLTLGTVIRKLSKGRNSHVPYRDSKLTRILQNALGGNARTAIICTMSPDRSHVEQSRNTLLFASCAKKVTTNAQVNLVMSDKALVKQLKRELARLENEMKSVGSTPNKLDTASMMREKELLIEQMAKEIEELTRQRDLAQSRVENLLLSVREVQMLTSANYSSSNSSEVINAPCTVDYCKHMDTVAPRVPMTNTQYLEPLPLEIYEEERHLHRNTLMLAEPEAGNDYKEVALKMDEEFEDNCKEVRCIEFEESNIKLNEKADVCSLIPEINEGKLTVNTDELPIGPEEQEGKPAMTESVIKEIEADNLSVIPADEEEKVSLTAAEDIEGKLTGTESRIEKQEGDGFYCNPDENQVKLTGTEASIEKQEGDGFYCNPDENQGKLDMTITMKENVVSSPQKEDLQSCHVNKDETCEALKQKIQELHKTIKFLVTLGDSPSALDGSTISGSPTLSRCKSCRGIITTVPSSPDFKNPQHNESTHPSTSVEKDLFQREKALSCKLSGLKGDNRNGKMSRGHSQNSFSSGCGEAQSVKDIDGEDNCSEASFAPRPWKLYGNSSMRRTSVSTDFSECSSVTKRLPEKQNDEDPAPETENAVKLHDSWPAEFENLQKKIIELWDACNVPLIHRTYFIMLFKGDPSDSIYMEVEFRRLSFLKNSMPLGSKGFKDTTFDTTASSAKDLIRERKMLCKQIQKLSKKQKEEVYKQWGIGLNTKQRSVQLSQLIWSKSRDMGHVKESAALVSKLLGFLESGQAPKEVVGLSILPQSRTRRSTRWNNVLPPLL